MRRSLVLLALVLCASAISSTASAQPCTGLCLQQVTCPASGTTSISGTVLAPNHVDPLPNVLVYIPNAAVQPFSPGVACSPGGQEASGSPLVQTTTSATGQFTLTNVPVGTNIPVVIQAGRWRRQVTVSNVPACRNTPMTGAQTSLPQNHTEGDIPKIAIVTGGADATECVLRKIGIQDSEFTNPGGTGRISVYHGIGGAGTQATGGAIINGSTPPESSLWGSVASLDQYDMTMFACQGDAVLSQPAAAMFNMQGYANNGGRIFGTHYFYDWLFQNGAFANTALWNPDQAVPPNQTAFVNQSFAKGQTLAQWLHLVGASPTLGQIPLQEIRRDQNGVIPPTQSWLSINNAPGAESVAFTFNTPVGAPPANQCGRVLFNEYHVEPPVVNLENIPFPSECAAGPMTAQEKLLEFMLFDLSTFTTPDEPSTVTLGFSNTPATFTQGDAADTVTIDVTNSSATIVADHTLKVTAAIPNGLSIVSMAGANASTGWTCSSATATCTRSTILAASASDPITLVLAAAPDAPVPGPVILTAVASGGGLASNVVAPDSIPIHGVTRLTWADPAAIAYGTALGGTQLNATANTPGTFAYAPASGAVLQAGTQTLSVTFTPDDPADFDAATATVHLQVDQATPHITWSNPAAITYGTALGGTQLNATADTAGTFAYSPASGVLNAGSQTLSVTFTPSDTVDYTTATASVTLVVNKATPVITWNNPAAIVYGTPIGALQLNATADTAGTFAYAPAAGAVLTAGPQPLNVSFTPSDTANYENASKGVLLSVLRATPVITWSNPADILLGTPLGGAQLNAIASVPGTFVYAPPSGTVLPAGAQSLSVAFAPSDAVDYTTASKAVSINVVTAPPVITGMPVSCSIWPPNGRLVTVATINASVSAGSLASFAVNVASNEPLGSGDVVIGGSGVQPRVVQLRADRLGKGNGRTYTITATATNSAGVVTTASASCVVPHDQGRPTGQ